MLRSRHLPFRTLPVSLIADSFNYLTKIEFILVIVSCDQGYGGSDCVSIEPLARNLIDQFDSTDESIYSSITGGNVSSSCGVITSAMATVFHQVIFIE